MSATSAEEGGEYVSSTDMQTRLLISQAFAACTLPALLPKTYGGHIMRSGGTTLDTCGIPMGWTSVEMLKLRRHIAAIDRVFR